MYNIFERIDVRVNFKKIIWITINFDEKANELMMECELGRGAFVIVYRGIYLYWIYFYTIECIHKFDWMNSSEMERKWSCSKDNVTCSDKCWFYRCFFKHWSTYWWLWKWLFIYSFFFSFMNIYQFRIVSRSNNDVNVETSKHHHNVWCYINGKWWLIFENIKKLSENNICSHCQQ